MMPLQQPSRKFPILTSSAFTVLVLSAAVLWGCPHYKVWQQRLEGEAELARASQNRQIKIREAEALKDAAVLPVVALVIHPYHLLACLVVLGAGFAAPNAAVAAVASPDRKSVV